MAKGNRMPPAPGKALQSPPAQAPQQLAQKAIIPVGGAAQAGPIQDIGTEIKKFLAPTFSALQALEAHLGYPVIAYVLKDGAQIADDVYACFVDVLRSLGNQQEIGLLVHTNGGQTETPYKLMSVLRAFNTKVNVLIPLKALSAGTHLAMGADRIQMTRAAQLGPVDPSRQHPLLPKDANGKPIAISVQDLRHCVAFIKREHVTELNGEAFAQVVSSLFSQVHPLAIGAIEESYALGQLVSRKMLEMHMDPTADKVQIDALVKQLSDGYSSHAFAFGQKEAESIGLKADLVDVITEDVMTQVAIAALNVQVEAIPNDNPHHKLMLGGLLLSRGRTAYSMIRLAPAHGQAQGTMEALGSQWALLP